MSTFSSIFPDGRKGVCSALVCLGILYSAGCATHRAGEAQGHDSAVREVRDDEGKAVRLPPRVERVVSLAPSLTEIVYAVGAGDRLVGDTSYCDYPPAARSVAKVGDTLHPSVERIVALKPQLVLVSTSSQLEAFTRQLEAEHISVYVTDPHDLEGVLASIKTLGDLLGEPERGETLAAGLRARASAVETTVRDRPRVRVFYQLSAEPLYTAGRDSFVTDLIRRAGGQSVTAEVPGAWPLYSIEAAVAAHPEAIIIPAGGSMGTANADLPAPLRDSPAARNGRVFRIDGDYLSRPGPRLVDGLEQLARALHPDAFR